MALTKLLELSGRINDLLNASSLLAWDSRTMMPPSGNATRGLQISTLTVAARDLLCSDEMRRAADEAEAEAGTAEADMISAVRHAIAYHDRIPADLVRRRNELAVTAHDVWAEACRQKDASIFLPALEDTVEICRAWVDHAGYEDHPYDAMLELYEPGNTVRNLTPLLQRLTDHIVPLARDVHAAPQPDDSFLGQVYPEHIQMSVAGRLARKIGYDLDRGRLDTALHPFEISFTRNDVRLTTWINRTWLPKSIFTTLHEAGHGIYEQNIDPAYTRTPLATDLVLLYAVGGVSFGMHESQSRLWENHVGRSRSFWEHHFATVHDAFPEQLSGQTPESFWQAVNVSRPGAKRSFASELTYDLHTILRTELERDLIAGDLKVSQVRDAWNAKTEEMLGVIVRDDTESILQDVHWPTGQFGTFCNYTIGNIVAAQLFATASQAEGVQQGLDAADYAPLREWLTGNVLRHGRRYIRDELLEAATGRTLDLDPYLAHLDRRFAAVYDIA
ncbi:carboxypeptidase M32 [Pseudoroseicyclus tamaricis]|uniref:Metal-dependent carboxypeptidase n=1 Tax=Pseudoroseicyclus tamaricis TaxID=2705421 RepID=A0A6B2JVB3_9RHOB|nr:carboxypeptidase M32 [Pseudoroseicyclus tamaricis]NDV00569.1 carboxypeptidase M32 [Pseudoroseicyclus tamaricis]